METNWNTYNEAQTTEKLIFLDILSELCSYVPDYPKQVGRPRAPLSQMVFSCVSKVYEQLSSRRTILDLEIARKKGYLDHTPHFNTILKYFGEPLLTPILTDLIKLSALPLKDLEEVFAVDASGLSSAFYSRWLDVRLQNKGFNRNWIKVHLICGVKTNIVTHIVVTDGKSQDSPFFSELVRETAKNFRIAEVCADRGYSSRDNLQTVADAGGVAYIPFKCNATDKSRGTLLWKKMYHYFQLHKEEFMQHYHQRSNAESTFSMLKRKFQGKLMMKKEVGQINEALAKVLCHNLCVLVRESIEGNAVLRYEKLAHLFPSLHIKELDVKN